MPPIAKQLASDETHIGNGDVSPEWGLDVECTGGTIWYGPWTDRQRGVLQEMFFPSLYKDAEVAEKLKVGDRRVYPYFKVLVEFKDDVIFKIPTKEKSKVLPHPHQPTLSPFSPVFVKVACWLSFGIACTDINDRTGSTALSI